MVEIIGIGRNKVRIGVEAPPEVRVLRHELAGLGHDHAALPDSPTQRRLSHAMRNRLNAANLALHLSRRQLQVGLQQEADDTLHKALDELAGIERELEGPGPDGGAPGPLRRALLVEDNPNESELLAGYLRMSGFEVDTAHDGCQALESLASGAPPDAVLLDMHMPRCDGPATVRAIRASHDYAGLKVFAVSGTSPRKLGLKIVPDGIDRWFPKPVNPQYLVEQIQRELNALVV
jgi:CheY-like chemotaxis protein